MTTPDHEHLNYTGHQAIDDHQSKVGKITDVVYDPATDSARWAIIRTSIFLRERVVPIDGSYMADDGRVVLAHDRATVKQAPTIAHDHVLDHRIEAEAARHYGLAA
jgi:hypothetical protein